jgi:predicted AAA+ superfamily ATPase
MMIDPMIHRPDPTFRVERAFGVHPIVSLLGPRQCGKTTLARMIAGSSECTYFDLEDPVDLRRLSAPMTVLEALSGLVVLDEVQRRPDLFELLRVLVDRPDNPARFLILGSASPSLVRGVSESLAGRVGFVDLAGFDLTEVGISERDRLWLRGGFPRSFLAADDDASVVWRHAFVRTLLERDIPQLGITIPSETLRRFWRMLAHLHGQVWNAAELARALGSSESTARRYLDILVGAFMVRVLPPWFENIGKRQVKSPKIYLRDSGLLHSLLELESLPDLQAHPKLGASWEGFVLEHVLWTLDRREAYFWATHAGAELDLMVTIRGRRHGFEFKFADAPASTRSMHIAVEDLALEHLWVIYPGTTRYDLTPHITVVPLTHVSRLSADLQSD